jgi:EAL domain-containing protein (putative c-di-GMP-specific phosphodiesterase class I)
MEHAGILRDMGCDVLQGFALAVPMTAPRLFHFIKTGGYRARQDARATEARKAAQTTPSAESA